MTFILEETPEGVDLVLTAAWSPAAEACLVEGRADGLVLNRARGFQEADLMFVRGLPIRRLNVLARGMKDLSPVYDLAGGLVSLRVQSDPRATIDLERLPLLQTLSADWSQAKGSIGFASQLEHLSASSYKEVDLTPLAALSSLASISMKQYPQLRSLDGIESFPRLVDLAAYGAYKLADISALHHHTSPVLGSVQLPSCKRVTDIAALASCPSLRFLELGDGAEILTVAPLSDLVWLDSLHLYGSTRVSDGDLTPIAHLPRLRDFRMMNRRGYTPSTVDIEEAIKSRS